MKDVEPTWMQPIRWSFRCKTAQGLQESFDKLESESIVGQRIISFCTVTAQTWRRRPETN